MLVPSTLTGRYRNRITMIARMKEKTRSRTPCKSAPAKERLRTGVWLTGSVVLTWSITYTGIRFYFHTSPGNEASVILMDVARWPLVPLAVALRRGYQANA